MELFFSRHRAGTHGIARIVLALSVLSVWACGPGNPPPTDVQSEAGDATNTDVISEPGCTSDEACNDNVFCNGSERCVMGRCQAGQPACDDRRSCTMDTCDEEAQMCTHAAQDSMCGMSNRCTGGGRCDPSAPNASPTTGCTAPSPDQIPDCDDRNNCTIDSCDPAAGCVHAPRDLDGDGHVDRMCTVDGTPGGRQGTDCNDNDPNTYPSAPELCNDNLDNNCNGLTDLQDSMACRPSNNSCATATVLRAAGTYWGSTVGLAHNTTLSCNPGTFPEAIFTFTTTETRDVTISTTATGTTAAIALVSDCGAMQTERRCNRALSGATPSLRVRSLPAGTYFIIAETGATGAAFRITLRLDPATPPILEETCPAMGDMPSQELTSGMPRTAMLSMYEDDITLSCNSFSARRDAVYRVTLTAPSDVVVTAAPMGTTTGTTYVSFRNSPCADAMSERRCISGSGTAGTTVTQRSLPAGTYWVAVENSAEANVNVTATITTPPAPRAPEDLCPLEGDMPAVELNDGMMRTAVLTRLEDDYMLSCGIGSNRKDAVYRLTLTEPRDVLVRATAVTGTTSLSVRNAPCSSNAGERRCVTGSGATGAVFQQRNMPAGTYWVIVEHSSDADVNLIATLTPPMPRAPQELCPGFALPINTATPTQINWGNSGATGSVDVLPDVGTTCGSRGTNMSYRDVVLRYQIGGPQDVTITIDPGGNTVFYELRSACDSTMSPVLTCTTALSSSTPVVRRIRNQPAGTYYLVMETTATTPTMPTTVRIDTANPVPQVMYTLSTPMGVSFENICMAPGAMSVLANIDDNTATVPLPPFPLRLYNNNATTNVVVSSNGWLALSPTSSSSAGGPFPSTSSPSLLVAALSSDLVTSSAGVCIATVGTAPNRRFIVQWQDANDFGGSASTQDLTFQIVFNEAAAGVNNTIDVVYQTLMGASRTYYAGVQNEDGTIATSIPGPYTAPRIVRLTPTSM